MPVKRSTSGLFAKLGAKLNQAVEAHREDEIVLGGGIDLPGGINFGIAQLVDCRFSVYKTGKTEGEYHLYMAGVVMSPETVKDEHGHDLPIKGLRTSLTLPCCARGNKSFDENIKIVTDELRKLGAEGKELSGENLEATAAALKETKPFFRFNTSFGKTSEEYPNPTIFHNWRGVCEYTDSGDSGVVDDSPDASEEEAVEEKPKTAAKPSSIASTASKGGKTVSSSSGGGKTPTTKKAPAPEPEKDEFEILAEQADSGDETAETEKAQIELDAKAKFFNVPKKKVDNAANWTEVADLIRQESAKDDKPEAEEEATEESEGEETVDYDALGSQADEGDEEAINSLTEAAEAAGLSLDDYPESWASLATALSEQGGESEEAVEEEAEEESAEFTPEVGGVFLYKFAGTKKATEVEITKIDEATKTCTVKNLDTGKKFAGIAFDKLEEAT